MDNTKKNFLKFVKANLNSKEIPSNKKILITGCSGFIGDYLVDSILDVYHNKNNKVYGIDLFNTKKSKKNFSFKKRDLYKLNKKNIPKVKFDYIIHLAGIPSPTYYKKQPLKTIYLNSELTRELLEIAKKYKSKFIFFSSSEIYGNPFSNFIPTKEDYLGNVSSISDRSCYDESKRMGETFSYIYKNYFDLDVKIIRPFNFYGNGMRFNDERIIPKFFSQIYTNKDLTVFSNGKQTRSYCHIFDAIVMINKIIFSGKKFVYNVGNPNQEITADQLAEKILATSKVKNLKINKIDYPDTYPSDEPKRRCPSIKRFRSELKFKPKITLDLGLKYFNNYAKENFNLN